MGRSNTPEDAFKFIDTHGNDPDVCWEWLGATGGRDHRGYFSMNGKKYIAPRVVFELFNEPLQEHEVVRHRCDNPICCNPTHLERGTRSENELDKYRRGQAGYPPVLLKRMRQLFKFRPSLSYRAIAERLTMEFRVPVSKSGVGAVYREERRAKELKGYGQGGRRARTDTENGGGGEEV